MELLALQYKKKCITFYIEKHCHLSTKHTHCIDKTAWMLYSCVMQVSYLYELNIVEMCVLNTPSNTEPSQTPHLINSCAIFLQISVTVTEYFTQSNQKASVEIHSIGLQSNIVIREDFLSIINQSIIINCQSSIIINVTFTHKKFRHVTNKTHQVLTV